jgi:hypothetical protein
MLAAIRGPRKYVLVAVPCVGVSELGRFCVLSSELHARARPFIAAAAAAAVTVTGPGSAVARTVTVARSSRAAVAGGSG